MKIERLEKPIPLTERNLPPEVIQKVLQNLRKALIRKGDEAVRKKQENKD